MKYCTTQFHTDSFLKDIDEIRVAWKDKEGLFDLVEKFPKKTFIVHVPLEATDINWSYFEVFTGKANIIMELDNIRICNECMNHHLKYMWSFAVSSFYELKGLADLRVSYVKLNAPLFFDLAAVKAYNIPIRAVVNTCYDSYIPRPDGVCGTYIRPEDIDTYAQYVDAIEFETEKSAQEEALLEIYRHKKEWKGNLNLIINGLNYNVDNRAIPDEFAEARIQCRQNCMRSNTCHFCQTSMSFSNTIKNMKES